eukprot:GEMP01018728.1.p1 GENE.GEMP01018728.1~~GEMP01018728.1.p1  ORF type:complete len:372 (+),score=50.88 GEMP01018728.1:71-1186(+)
MIGSFNDVFIWVSPRIQDGSIWSIDAKQVSYEIDAQGVAKLSIVTRRSVKVEPQDDGARSGCTTLFSTPVEEKSSDDARKTANCAHGVSPMSPPPKRPKIIPHEPNKNPEGSKADVSAAVSSKKRVTKATLKKQTGVKLNTHSAPGGAVSSKSGTNVRSWNLCSVPGCVQRAGGGRRCWRHGSVGCCSVEDCSTPSQGIVAASDHFGPPGRRCRRHGGYKLCDVAGCNTSFQSFIPTSDAFGPSGRRCRRHGGYTLCNVEGCTRPSQVTAKNADTFGLPGRRLTKRCVKVALENPASWCQNVDPRHVQPMAGLANVTSWNVRPCRSVQRQSPIPTATPADAVRNTAAREGVTWLRVPLHRRTTSATLASDV